MLQILKVKLRPSDVQLDTISLENCKMTFGGKLQKKNLKSDDRNRDL